MLQSLGFFLHLEEKKKRQNGMLDPFYWYFVESNAYLLFLPKWTLDIYHDTVHGDVI